MSNKKIFSIFTLKLAFLLAFFSSDLFAATKNNAQQPLNTVATAPISVDFQLPCIPILFEDEYNSIAFYDSSNTLVYVVSLYGSNGDCTWKDISESENKKTKSTKNADSKNVDSKAPAQTSASSTSTNSTTAQSKQADKSITIQEIMLEMKQDFQIKVKLTLYKKLDKAYTINVPISYKFQTEDRILKSGSTKLDIKVPIKADSSEKIYTTKEITIEDKYSGAIYPNLDIIARIDLTDEQHNNYKKYAQSLKDNNSLTLKKREELADKIWEDRQKAGFIEE